MIIINLVVSVQPFSINNPPTENPEKKFDKKSNKKERPPPHSLIINNIKIDNFKTKLLILIITKPNIKTPNTKSSLYQNI